MTPIGLPPSLPTSLPPGLRYRGGPLVMILLLVAGWGLVRAAAWEDPFAAPAAALDEPPPTGLAPRSLASPMLISALHLPEVAYDPVAAGLPGPDTAPGMMRAARPRRLLAYATAPELDLPGIPRWPSPPPGASRAEAEISADRAPFLAPPAPRTAAAGPGRWSLDAWSFWKQGSDAAPVSQGRVPIYGASQAGAVLQYRLGRANGHDPRLYLRAYRALVLGGESEVAFGASLRPLPRVPVRLAAEARYTEFVTGGTARPAAYAVTELAPVRLPAGTQLDAYGQAGWVGGEGQTAFADGQASITRDLGFAGRMSHDALRLSVGAGVWGGAQQGGGRLDIGPTLRLDLKVGRVPARISVDWRERIGGDAAPGSGVAATVSTGF